MKNVQLLILFVIMAILSAQHVFAQENDPALQYRKWRVTLINPISTNGLDAPFYTAKYSLNIIGGYHGGLNGYEFGGIYNYTKRYSRGFQLAGITNLSGGNMDGFNIAGLLNGTSGSLAGLQFAGAVNYSANYQEGIQVAGLLNMAGSDLSGLQFAGLANLSKEDQDGLRISGAVNVAGGSVSGLQLAGVGTLAGSDLEGLSVAGVLNSAKDNMSGLFVSGLMNTAGGSIEGLGATGGFHFAKGNISGLYASGIGTASGSDIDGLIASGAFTVAKGDLSGLIASGLLNAADELDGLAVAGLANLASEMNGLNIAAFNLSSESSGMQVGIINLAREFEGVPVGIISLYGNGRKNVDLRYSDAGFTELGINLGTYRVYNMLLLGYNTLLDRDVYRLGLAVGLEKPMSDSFKKATSGNLYVNQEFSFSQQFENSHEWRTNQIWSYKFLLGSRLGSGLSLYAGPSFNMQVSRVNEASDYTWYSLWSPTRKGRQYRFWVGITAGVRLFKQKELPSTYQGWEKNSFGWDW